MTSLEVEEELFGASLSMDFDPALSPNNRPWQQHHHQQVSSRPSPRLSSTAAAAVAAAAAATRSHNGLRSNYNDRYREPYELLDDVPPAVIPNNNYVDADVPTPARYPVEQLYPAVDESGNGNGRADIDVVGRNALRRDRHPNPGRPPRPPQRSRYPIDDAISLSSSRGDDSSYSTCSERDYSPTPQRQRRRQDLYDYYGVRNNASDMSASITESRSDSEISDYRPMNGDEGGEEDEVGEEDHYERQESEDGGEHEQGSGGSVGRLEYEYDNASAYSSSQSHIDSGCGSSSGSGNVSDYEMGEISSKGSSKSKRGVGGYGRETSFANYPREKLMARSRPGESSFDRLYNDEMNEMEVDSTGSKSGSAKIDWRPMSESQHGTPGDMASESSADVSPREDPKWVNIKVDVTTAPAPQRSNLPKCQRPDSPSQRAATSPAYSPSVATTKNVADAAPTSSSHLMEIYPGDEVPSTLLKINPVMKQTGDDSIFRVHCADSCDSSSAVLSLPSAPSNDSAIQHLASFQSMSRQEKTIPPPSPAHEVRQRSHPAPGGFKRSTSPPSHMGSGTDSGSKNRSDSSHQSYYTSRKDLIDLSRPRARKEDPPDEDLGYYPQSEYAREPEGFRQHKLFPDIDLWGDENGDRNVHRNAVVSLPPPVTSRAAMVAQDPVDNDRQQQKQQQTMANHEASMYNELEYYESQHEREPVGDRCISDEREDTGDLYKMDVDYKCMHREGNNKQENVMDDYSGDHNEGDYESIADMSSFPHVLKKKKGIEVIGFKSRDGQIEDLEYYYHPTNGAESVDGDDRMANSNDEDSSSSSSSSICTGDCGRSANHDGVSVISEDTQLRNFSRQHRRHQKKEHKRQRHEARRRMEGGKSQYVVKRKDSMESDIKIDFDDAAEKKKPISPQKGTANHYAGIKQNDSMEKEMSIDFDGVISSFKNQASGHGGSDKEVFHEEEVHQIQASPRAHMGGIERRMGSSGSYDRIASPPEIERKPFSFECPERGEEDNMKQLKEYAGYELERSNEHSRSNDYRGRSRSIVTDTSYSSDDGGEDCSDDESEASNDPTIFPSKAISRMNLGCHTKDDSENESEDLVEQACHNLSRGRNLDALNILTEALHIAQAKVDDAKRKLDSCYRRGGSKNQTPRLIEDDMKDRIYNSASEMANVLNNIGVVHELNGDYQHAMNTFREALEVYRNVCHRYENAGDADVDRTVSNIMQMSIAMKSHNMRTDLHREAEELAAQKSLSENSDICTKLRNERLNILMSVLDLETESLGREHPTVGFTLLKKAEVYLEMNHVDMAIKDVKKAVSILKMGLGGIHPEVGLALMMLADIFNYDLGQFAGGYDRDHKNTALSLYQEALVPLRESFGRINSHLGLAYNCIGILRASRGELKHAMKSFYNALASFGVRRRADNEASADKGGRIGQSSCPDAFFVWINVGGLHMERQEWQLALRSYLKAYSAFHCLGAMEKTFLRKIGPRNLMWRSLTLSKSSFLFDDNDIILAAVLKNIGKAQSMLQQYGKATETLEEALRLHQVVALRGANRSRGLAYPSSSLDEARIHQLLGEVQMISGDLTSAFGSYVKSLDLIRANKHINDSRIEEALVLGAIGRVHLKKGEFAEAKVVLKESMRTFDTIGVPSNNHRINDIRSCLVDSELALIQNATPTLAGQRRELSSLPYSDKALAIDEIADAYRNKGDYTGAIWFYSEALNLRRVRLEHNSRTSRQGDSSEMVDVGRTLSNIAALRRERREFGAAKILFNEAKQLYKCVGLSVGHPFYRDLTKEIEVMRKM